MARTVMRRAAVDFDIGMQDTFPCRTTEPAMGWFGDQDILITACCVFDDLA